MKRKSLWLLREKLEPFVLGGKDGAEGAGIFVFCYLRPGGGSEADTP